MSEFRCRHRHAFPWMFIGQCGVMWCPECGAIRECEAGKDNSIFFSKKKWIYPRGLRNVQEQMERNATFDDNP